MIACTDVYHFCKQGVLHLLYDNRSELPRGFRQSSANYAFFVDEANPLFRLATAGTIIIASTLLAENDPTFESIHLRAGPTLNDPSYFVRSLSYSFGLIS